MSYGVFIDNDTVDGVYQEVKYEAFMENDGEFVVEKTVNGVVISRTVVKEAVAYALADLVQKDLLGS